MKIGKIFSDIEYRFESDRIVKNALKYSQERQKIKADSFKRRFASTHAGYTPPEYKKPSVFKQMFEALKDHIRSFDED